MMKDSAQIFYELQKMQGLQNMQGLRTMQGLQSMPDIRTMQNLQNVQSAQRVLNIRKRRERLLERINARLQELPPGRLRISSGRYSIQFFCCQNDDKVGEYIPAGKMQLVELLAEKRYLLNARRILKMGDRIDFQSEEMLSELLETVYFRLPEIVRTLVKPLEPTWEMQLNAWRQQPYCGKDFSPGSPVIMTLNGERVRSKSEKILADLFRHYEIPYKYECPLTIENRSIYPDFTFLSRRLRKEIYWEHFGRMEDQDYLRKTILKMQTYLRSGIFLGEQLLITFESNTQVLDTQDVELMIRRYLI